MILQAVTNFQPDLVLVDKVAAGVQGELLPALRYLRAYSPQTRLVLGMRDIEDSPEITRREWAANGTPQLLSPDVRRNPALWRAKPLRSRHRLRHAASGGRQAHPLRLPAPRHTHPAGE
jgi:hypothetical protein